MTHSKAGRSGKPTAQVQQVIDAMLLAGFERHWFSVRAKQIYRGQEKYKLKSGVPVVRSIFEQGSAIVTLRWWRPDFQRGLRVEQLQDLIEPMLETGELDVKLYRYDDLPATKLSTMLAWGKTEIKSGTGVKKIVISQKDGSIVEYTVYPDGREEERTILPPREQR